MFIQLKFNAITSEVIFFTSGVERSIIGGGGGGEEAIYIHIFVFTNLKNNRFQNNLIMQNTNI